MLKRAIQDDPGALRECANALQSALPKDKMGAFQTIAVPILEAWSISKTRRIVYADPSTNADYWAKNFEKRAEEIDAKRSASNLAREDQGTSS